MQQSLLWLFLVLTGISVFVFYFVYRSSRQRGRAQQGMVNALQKRFWFILILFVILGIFASVTIPQSPYYFFADEQPSKVIHVGAGQFYFVMSDQAVDPANPAGEAAVVVEVDELVEFRVTSLDVNHGFAIYDPSNVLIAQTQAMPGYVNRLRWKFEEPGVYMVYCLEYCGMAHQVMQTSFTVK